MKSRVVAGTEASGQAVLLTDIKGLERMLGRDERSLWRDLGAGKIPAPIKLGRLTKWRVADIREWIAAGCPDCNSWKPCGQAT
jgi:predicted DNA-binding transcriptional regulator AlpA